MHPKRWHIGFRANHDGQLACIWDSAEMVSAADFDALLAIVQDAELACDEWEVKNGDAPHRVVKLGDRIRVNAGLYSESGKDCEY